MPTELRNSNLPSGGNRLAKRSCESCKLRKRKCTRELPKCRLCVRCVRLSGRLRASSLMTARANCQAGAVDVAHVPTNPHIISITSTRTRLLKPIPLRR
jgi:hypothetical protein